MNTAIIPFHFEVHTVRTQMIEGEPWFVLADVCKVLEIRNSGDAAARLDDDEKADVGITDTSSGGVQQSRSMIVINESGLYSLIMTSRKPQAKRFKKWVTAEVLPTIRKTGSYGTPQLPSFEQLERLANLTAVAIENKAGQLRTEFRTELSTFEASMPITGEQTGPIKKAVRDLAQKMGGKPHHFRQAWRTLYDRYGIAAYRDLPRNKYDEALEFIAKVAKAYEGREIS